MVSGEVSEFFRALVADSRDRADAATRLHAALEAQGLLSRVTLHRYMCKRGCQIATVFSIENAVYCAVRDYKLSHGLNRNSSTPKARARNTLDGERHWPSVVYEVQDGIGRNSLTMVCRHTERSVDSLEILALVAGVEPGRPGKPTRF